jgi:hypothetical protein
MMYAAPVTRTHGGSAGSVLCERLEGNYVVIERLQFPSALQTFQFRTHSVLHGDHTKRRPTQLVSCQTNRHLCTLQSTSN